MIRENFFHSINNTHKDKIAMVCCLYKGHRYKLYKQYYNQILENHLKFANINKFDYFLFNDNLNNTIDALQDRPEFAVFPKTFCFGISKWYALDYIFKNTEYTHILMIDFDTAFLKYEKINFDLSQQQILSDTGVNQYYDSVYFLYYCLVNGIEYKDFCKYTYKKYSTGFILIRRDFFTKQNLDNFVNFACKLKKEKFLYDNGILKDIHWIHTCDFSHKNIHDTSQTTITPYDEVFLTYQLLLNKTKFPSIFEQGKFNITGPFQWNNNLPQVSKEVTHIHFNIKSELINFFKSI